MEAEAAVFLASVSAAALLKFESELLEVFRSECLETNKKLII